MQSKKNTCNFNFCEREVWDFDSKFCVYHSSLKNDKQEEFNKRFKEDFPNKFISNDIGVIDFSFFSFPDNFVFPSFDGINNEILFHNTFFYCIVDFSNSTFNRKITFENSTFFRDSSFFNSIFKAELSFNNVEFKQEAIFKKSTFEYFLFFEKCRFFNKVDFSFCNFECESVYFDGVSFFSYLYFDISLFYKEIIMLYCEFHKSIDLNRLRFQKNGKIIIANSHLFLSFSIKEISAKVTLELDDSISYELLAIHNVSINQISINNFKNLGYLYLNWEELRIRDAIYCYHNQENNSKIKKNSQLANAFQTLKENYHKLGEYQWEDEAYVEYKKCIFLSKTSNNNIVFYLFNFFQFKCGKYGTDPLSIFYTMIATIPFFGILYLLPCFELSYKCIIPNNDIINSICIGFYHSTVTFLTIGYGDVSPQNIPAILLSGVEGFVGLFLMSYFTVAFVRKVLR